MAIPRTALDTPTQLCAIPNGGNAAAESLVSRGPQTKEQQDEGAGSGSPTGRGEAGAGA